MAWLCRNCSTQIDEDDGRLCSYCSLDEEPSHTCTARWVTLCDGSGLLDHDCGEDSCCCADPDADRDDCPGCPACCPACDNEVR